jgi:hypothetical protein
MTIEMTDTAAGANPGAGATPSPAGQTGPATGATPPAAAATSPAPPPAPATDDANLGEAGKAILREARRVAKEAADRADAAERALAEAQESTQTAQERAISQAKREATAEANARWSEIVRDGVIEGALRGAGITSDKVLALLKAAPELRALKANESGQVDGVTAAVEALKADPEYAVLFGSKSAPTPPTPGGAWGGSEGGSIANPAATGIDRMRNAYNADSH